MLSVEREKIQDRLEKQLYKLSEKLLNEEEVSGVTSIFKEIYSADFRHNYSDFFPLILNMNKEDTKYNLDYLSSNLETLRSYVEDCKDIDDNELSNIHKKFAKLCDHLNLEISRVLYYSNKEKAMLMMDQKIENVSLNVEKSTAKLEEAIATAKAVQNKAESIQTELISVLSIFAAIVIAFSGSLTFIGSAVTAASNTFILKLVFILLVCAICLFNSIVVMLYLIGKIIGKELFLGCKADCCSCTLQKHRCSSIKKIRMRIPYVFYFNIFVILFLIADFVMWIIYRHI